MINDTLSERCTGSKKDGSPCGRIAGRDTSAGFRSAHHDPDRPQTRQDGPRRPRASRPPVDALVAPADGSLQQLGEEARR